MTELTELNSVSNLLSFAKILSILIIEISQQFLFSVFLFPHIFVFPVCFSILESFLHQV